MPRTYHPTVDDEEEEEERDEAAPDEPPDEWLSRRALMRGGAVALAAAGLARLPGVGRAQTDQEQTNCTWLDDQDAAGYRLWSSGGVSFYNGAAADFSVPSGEVGISADSSGRLVEKTPSGNTKVIQELEVISATEDLPATSNGRHQLADSTGYLFNGFVTSSSGLELGDSTVLLGNHAALDGFIHTGANTAVYGRDVGFFARNLYLHAPGGTLLDLNATTTDEMLVESCSFSDAAGLGNMASLGTISDYRVPSFKGCNFENFNAGLTLTGTPDKVFFSGCPFRSVSASGVTIITADANFSTDILKISTDCYIKSVQSDTEVVRVDPSATIDEYFKYFNVDHDPSVTKSNILNGQVGVNEVGTIVRNSFPLPDSNIAGTLSLDSAVTVTGSGSGPTKIDDGTYTLNLGERVSKPSAGTLQYDARYDHDVEVTTRLSVEGANTEFSVWIAQNGSTIARSRSDESTSGSSKPTTVETDVTVQDATSSTPDQFSVYLENTGGNTDLTVNTMRFSLGDE